MAVILRKVTRGRRAGAQPHLDAFALVVIAASRNRPKVSSLGADITHHHLGIALKATASQDYRTAFEADWLVVLVRCDQAADHAGFGLNEFFGRRFVEKLHAEFFGKGREGLNQLQTTTRNCDAR